MTISESFQRTYKESKVAHLAIDLNRFYCDPEFDYPLSRACYSMHSSAKVARMVDDFADVVRLKAETIWFTHRIGSHVSLILDDNPALDEGSVESIVEESLAICGRKKPPTDLVMEKRNQSAFEDTDLGYRLSRMDKTHLLVTGVFKDACVTRTAEAARKLGYEVILVDDLCLWSKYANKNPGFKCQTNSRQDSTGIWRMRSEGILDMVQA